MTTVTTYLRPAAVFVAAILAAFSLAVLASATEPLPGPSPTAGIPAQHEFFVESVPPPMPKDPPVGKLGGSLAPAKLAQGPAAKAVS